jgi:hypothetical protein
MRNARKCQVLAVILFFVFRWDSASFAQSAATTKTQVVMLGTGTPLPDPQRSGPSTVIEDLRAFFLAGIQVCLQLRVNRPVPGGRRREKTSSGAGAAFTRHQL